MNATEQSGFFYVSQANAPAMTNLFRSTGDLFLVVAWTLGAAVAVLEFGVGPSLLRTALVLPLVLLFPGYALVSVLFPERPTETGGAVETEGAAGIDGIERFVLSVGASVALVPLVAFVVNFTDYGIRLQPIMVAVGGLTVLLCVFGYLARISRPVERRYGVAVLAPLEEYAGRYLSVDGGGLREQAPLEPRTEGQRLLNIGFLVALLVLAASVGYAGVTQEGGNDPFSEFYLLSQTDEGDFVAENLPHEFAVGESRTLWVAIGNHEGQRIRYTVVVTLGGEEIDRFRSIIKPERTVRFRRAITPQQTGDRLKLAFLLYRGQVPENPTSDNAYRETHLWVSVGGGG